MVYNYQENCILECSRSTDTRSDFLLIFLQRMSGYGVDLYGDGGVLAPLDQSPQLRGSEQLMHVPIGDKKGLGQIRLQMTDRDSEAEVAVFQPASLIP